MRIHPSQAFQRRARHGQQVVDDGQLHLGHNREVVREQQVVIAVDAAANRVLDGHDPVRRRPGIDGVEDLLEAPARDEPGVRIHPSRRSLAERARLALICDVHRNSRLVSGCSPRASGFMPWASGPTRTPKRPSRLDDGLVSPTVAALTR